jgi:CrcB protein
MRKLLYIGCGSFVGAVLRYSMKGTGGFPAETLLMNVFGSFLLALILTFFFEVRRFDEDVRLGLTVGLLGGFTTFSTLCRETVGLYGNGEALAAAVYVTLSAVLGLFAVFAGVTLARQLGTALAAVRERDATDWDNDDD